MRKRWRIAAVVAAFVVAFALAAQAAHVVYPPNVGGNPGSWYSINQLACSPTKPDIVLKSDTWGFGPLDSTGTTEMRYKVTPTGSYIYMAFVGEHDGITKSWNTGRSTISQAQVRWWGLSSVGDGKFYFSCT